MSEREVPQKQDTPCEREARVPEESYWTRVGERVLRSYGPARDEVSNEAHDLGRRIREACEGVGQEDMKYWERMLSHGVSP